MRTAKRQFSLLAFVLPLLISISSCGGGSSTGTNPPPAKAEFLYTIAFAGTPPNLNLQLLTFKVDPSSGALSGGSSIPWSGLYPSFAVDPASRYLYASVTGANGFGIFSIDAVTGVPTSSGGFLVQTGICGFGCPPVNDPGYVAVDPNGKYLFYGSSTFGLPSQQIGALTVNGTTGALNTVPGSPFPANQMPFFVLVHPSGQFVYTEDLSAAGPGGFVLQSVSGYAVDPTSGALAPVPQSPFIAPANSHVVGFAMHPSGKFLYAPRGATSGILGWSVDAMTGTLTTLPGSPFQPGITALDGSFDPAGKYFYVAGGATGGIIGFSVDSNTGFLTALSGSPFSAGSTLGVPTVDLSGRYVYATDFTTNGIVGFSLNSATGALTPLGNPTPASAHPGSLTIVKAP
jgi:6-phosphogluconolactonase (cycloisomerase 2 family)